MPTITASDGLTGASSPHRTSLADDNVNVIPGKRNLLIHAKALSTGPRYNTDAPENIMLSSQSQETTCDMIPLIRKSPDGDRWRQSADWRGPGPREMEAS